MIQTYNFCCQLIYSILVGTLSHLSLTFVMTSNFNLIWTHILLFVVKDFIKINIHLTSILA